MDDVAGMAERIPPFDLPRLQVADLGPFLALRESAPCPALNALADACVTELDTHRMPAGADEIARRRKSGLNAEQDAMLLNWGYPHVLQTWRFHMTLTRRLSPAEHDQLLPRAQSFFEAALQTPRQVVDICIFTQAGQGQPFMLAERVPLRG